MRKFFFIILLLSLSPLVSSEEGMYPLSELNRLNLADRGLSVTVQDIYNTDGTGLVNAIVRVGGCTGSFVSTDGLIITNHHCAFGSVQAASDAEHNYVRDGFAAQNRGMEIPARSLTVRITESYTDVTQQVLSALNSDMSPLERTKALEQQIKELEKTAETQTPGMRAEVAEMFPGKTYWLFRYTYLRDVRLVYVPPRSIGEYGGEADNWVWPRHAGDFSFMRVYTGPDGNPADYAAENVPYQPRRFLKVNADGVNDGDAVFVLGYPGRTYRHRTAHYMAFQYEVYMPEIVSWYQWQIDEMERISASDPAQAIQLSSRIKGLANVMKKYRGQLKAMGALNLVQKKKQQELELQRFIMADPKRAEQYGHILGQIGAHFDDVRKRSPHDVLLRGLTSNPAPLSAALTIVEASHELQKPDIERESRFMERNLPQTRKRLELICARINRTADTLILSRLLEKAVALPDDQRIAALDRILGKNADEHVVQAYVSNAFDGLATDATQLQKMMELKPDELAKRQDPIIQLARALYPEILDYRQRARESKGKLDVLQAHLLDVEQLYAAETFIPDANSTFRMTFGHVRGYSPTDAVWYEPVTTLTGVMQKATGHEPFDPPQTLRSLYQSKDFGPFVEPESGQVPVALLYDTDTTGGNSGSPVMDKAGDIVGVNFDRSFEATINDYAWSQDYSRSIGVDIRYVLFILDKYADMQDLLHEMNVK